MEKDDTWEIKKKTTAFQPLISHNSTCCLWPLTSFLSVVCKVRDLEIAACSPVDLKDLSEDRQCEDFSLTLIGGFVVTSHLHRRSLHSRHIGESIEDGDGDGNGNKEAANKRPQVAPPHRRLLSHHLDRKQQKKGHRHHQNHDDTQENKQHSGWIWLR